MGKVFARALLVAAGLLLSLSMAWADAPVGRITTKNIIIMISDGCGFNQVDAASLYQYGEIGKQVYESFPYRCAVSTYSAEGKGYDPAQAWTNFDYVSKLAPPTDSAAAATAMATGVKTYDAAIGVDVSKKPLKNIAQYAEEVGKSTGVVTTVPISHATPAGFSAHNESRNNYAQIAEEMLRSGAAEVVMGGGNPLYDGSGNKLDAPKNYAYVGGQATWDELTRGTLGGDANGDGTPDPWTLIQARADFQKLMTGDTPVRVCGVAQVSDTLQQGRAGDGKAVPYAVQRLTSVPTLAEMANGALNVLDNNPKGFFLMVEGGAIDWTCHANQSGREIEEEIDFNDAVNAVVAWVNANSNWDDTLLIVTADHETGYLTAPGATSAGVKLASKGVNVQPEMEWHSGGHTDSLVPIYAKGAGAHLLLGYATHRDPVRGLYINNTNIFDLMKSLIAAPAPVAQ